jgi:GAF domain-containing protein
LIACYAYDRKKFFHKRMEMGEGLVGQCILDSDSIYMDEVPDNYVNITSGLGFANPQMILLVPLKVNDKILGVIELASFKTLQPYHIKFIETLAESLASVIANIKINEHTQILLQESRKQLRNY